MGAGRDRAVTPREAAMLNGTKLTVELVPSTCWFSNVRDHVDAETWDRLRRGVYSEVGRRCAVCGGVGPRWPVECHEVWQYDDERGVQTLVGLTGLCPACHEVKHMGLANTRGRGAEAREHLARVNGWTRAQADEYVAEAFRVWEERSQHEWTLDLAWLERLGVRVASKRGPAAARAGRPADASEVRAAPEPASGGGAVGEAAEHRGPQGVSPGPSESGVVSSDARRPSEVTDDFWVTARRTGGGYPAHTERGGKWLVFVLTEKLDDSWGRITAALEAGDLGERAKAATARPNPNAADPAKKVICVYTYDGDDEDDVWRVRAALRRRGFTEPLSWKPDQATRDGQYQVRGHTRVSRYRG